MLTETRGTTRPSVVSLAAIFVLSHNAPPQEMATHIAATFLSSCFIKPKKWPIIYHQSENDVSFHAKNDPCDFQLHQGCQPQQARFCFAFINTESKIEVSMAKNKKINKTLGIEMGNL